MEIGALLFSLFYGGILILVGILAKIVISIIFTK